MVSLILLNPEYCFFPSVCYYFVNSDYVMLVHFPSVHYIPEAVSPNWWFFKSEMVLLVVLCMVFWVLLWWWYGWWCGWCCGLWYGWCCWLWCGCGVLVTNISTSFLAYPHLSHYIRIFFNISTSVIIISASFEAYPHL